MTTPSLECEGISVPQKTKTQKTGWRLPGLDQDNVDEIDFQIDGP